MAKLQLKKLKEIDNKTKNLISGYNKTISKNLSHHNLFQHIPLMIHSLCILYYFIPEHFEIEGLYAKISKDKKSVTWTNNDYESTTYGFMKISSLESNIKCRWSIYVNNGQNRNGSMISIGISSNNEYNKDYTAWRMDQYNKLKLYSHYAYNGWAGYTTSNHGVGNQTEAQSFFKGDTIDCVLDLKHKKVTFYKNGLDQNNAFTDIDIGNNIVYRLAISMGSKNNKVTIVKFKKEYI